MCALQTPTQSCTQQQKPRVPEQKVILLGDFGVGKTSLFRRFTTNTFTTASDRKSTLGLDFYTRAFNHEDISDIVKIQLWDTGGMERVASITSSYYKFAEAAILVFDLSNPDTFHSLAQHLIEVASYAENCKVFLCGNKVDLVHHDACYEFVDHNNSSGGNGESFSIIRDNNGGGSSSRREESSTNSSTTSYCQHVTLRDMEQFCEQTSVITNMYITSCKSNKGVNEMFTDISRQIKNASRARYELAKHAVLHDSELPFQLNDVEEDERGENQCAC